jgi:hypothetical protein
MLLMRDLVRTALAAVVAVLLFAQVASAELLWDPLVQDITATSVGVVTFRSSLVTVTCNMTLRGSVNSFDQTTADWIGAFEAGATSGCSSGMSVTPQFTTPTLWIADYRSFTGTLPHPSSIGATLDDAQFLIGLPALRIGCLYIADVITRLSFPGTSPNRVVGLSIDGTNIPAAATLGGVSCPVGSISGVFNVSPAAPLVAGADPIRPASSKMVGANATRAYRFINNKPIATEITSITFDLPLPEFRTDPSPPAGLPIPVGAGATHNFTVRYVPAAGAPAAAKRKTAVVVATRDANGIVKSFSAALTAHP